MSTHALTRHHRFDHLAANVAASVGVAVAVNAVVFLAGWDGESGQREASFAPPGWAIGSIWLILFAFMGTARAALSAESSTAAKRLITLTTLLIGVCATYPFYTAGLDNGYVALAGAIVTLLLSAYIAVRSRHVAALAAALIAPVSAWSIFASAIVIRGIQLNG